MSFHVWSNKTCKVGLIVLVPVPAAFPYVFINSFDALIDTIYNVISHENERNTMTSEVRVPTFDCWSNYTETQQQLNCKAFPLLIPLHGIIYRNKVQDSLSASSWFRIKSYLLSWCWRNQTSSHYKISHYHHQPTSPFLHPPRSSFSLLLRLFLLLLPLLHLLPVVTQGRRSTRFTRRPRFFKQKEPKTRQ